MAATRQIKLKCYEHSQKAYIWGFFGGRGMADEDSGHDGPDVLVFEDLY